MSAFHAGLIALVEGRGLAVLSLPLSMASLRVKSKDRSTYGCTSPAAVGRAAYGQSIPALGRPMAACVL